MRELDQRRPEDAGEVLREALARRWAAVRLRILLADHERTALVPLAEPGGRLLIADSTAGEAFLTQAPVVRSIDRAEVQIHLPMSVRGDRIGVLQVVLPGPIGETDVAELADVSMLVGYALNVRSGPANLVERVPGARRLTLAEELQWQLLAGSGTASAEYELYGHLEPACGVHSDSFDWSDGGSVLQLSVCDAEDHARKLPLLTTLAVTALRNARRGQRSIAEQVVLADQAVYAHHQGDHSVNALLVSIDTSTGRACAVRAGSPRLLRVRGGEVSSIELVDQLPIGLFEGTDYVEEFFELVEGDRLVLVSDGVPDTFDCDEDAPGGMSLAALLESTARTPAPSVVRTVIDAVMEQENGELFDDATVLCVDWHGPGGA